MSLERIRPRAIFCYAQAGAELARLEQLDAVGVVDEFHDGVGIGRVADKSMPFVDRDLAGN